MKKLELHWKILIGMVLGVAFGALAVKLGWNGFVVDWIKPFGTIFINLLKLIAIPLIVASLIKGVSDLEDIAKLSSMGYKTIGFYLITTAVAISVGLIIVNIVEPGYLIDEPTRAEMMEKFGFCPMSL